MFTPKEFTQKDWEFTWKKILLCRLEQSQEHQKQFVRQAEW